MIKIMKLIGRNLKFWHLGAAGLILLVLVMVSFFYSPQKATFQTSPSADDYVFIGEYNAGSSDPLRKCPTGYNPIYTSAHIGGNYIGTCFKDNDKISQDNNLVIAIGSSVPLCAQGSPIYEFKKYQSEHIGGNIIKTCSKVDLSPAAYVLGVKSGVPPPSGTFICPSIGGKTYSPKYPQSRHIGGNYIGTCVSTAPAAISATLTANPSSGLPPFTSTLTATVNNAIGFGAKVYFMFDCGNGQTFNTDATTPNNQPTATVTKTAACNYTEFKTYTPTVKVYQGDSPITYDGAAIKATSGLTDLATGQPNQIQTEIKQIKIREVAP